MNSFLSKTMGTLMHTDETKSMQRKENTNTTVPAATLF